MVATTGHPLADEAAVRAMGQVLLPLAAVVTPNGQEAARLLGTDEPITEVYAAGDAAKQICSRFGAKACIVTGIKRPNDDEGEAVDLYYDGNEMQELTSAWRPHRKPTRIGLHIQCCDHGGVSAGRADR